MKSCLACGHPNEDPAEMCAECWGTEFEPVTGGPAPPPPGEAVALRLDFDGGWSVELAKGDQVQLGRDGEWSPYAGALADYPHVSSRHATVGVRPDGKSWIRDERSRNGTFHNGRRIASDAPCPLAHGDRIKLSTRLAAQVSHPEAAE